MRLIDADELKKHAYKSADWDKPRVVDVEDIDDAPTVNPWHYPSKGEYPKEGETVLLLTNEGDPHLGHFANEYYWETDSFFRTSACIKCWQYIVPPNEDA